MSLLFNVRGHVVNADGVALYAEKAKPRPKREVEAKHMGFAVEGFPPGCVEAAKGLADQAVADWLRKDDEGRRLALKNGRREPKPWDEGEWLKKNKPKRVAKPYSMPGPADIALELARKQGWTHLNVRELIREAS